VIETKPVTVTEKEELLEQVAPATPPRARAKTLSFEEQMGIASLETLEDDKALEDRRSMDFAPDWGRVKRLVK